MKRKLKDYSIKTKVIIEEHRQRIKEGNTYHQPFICYSYTIMHPYKYTTSCGGFKTMKQLMKSLQENLK